MGTCAICKYKSVSTKEYPCNECLAGFYNAFEPEHYTNADKIRSMSDEELAEFINKVNKTCIVDALGGYTRCDYEECASCTECKGEFCGIQNWLQSEVED